MPVNRTLKILLPLLLLLAGLAAAAAIYAQRPRLAVNSTQAVPPQVQVQTLTPQTLTLNVASRGLVTAATEIDWVAEVAGKIVYLSDHLVNGGFFNKGDLLLSIDAKDYQLAIASAEARIAEAKRMVAQEQAQTEQAQNEWQALGEGQPTPLSLHQPQLAEAYAKLKAAEADLLKAKLQYERCQLRAPFNGRVLRRQVGLGQYVQAGAVVARLYATDKAEVRLPVSTDQLAYLNLPLHNPRGSQTPLLPVTLTAELGGKLQQWQGRIARAEADIDTANGQLHLIAVVDAPFSERHPQPLLPGLFVHADIAGQPQSGVFTIPVSAVNTAQQVALVGADQKIQLRAVKILRQSGEQFWIKDGLSAGERLVIAGLPLPVDGMSVSVDTGTAP